MSNISNKTVGRGTPEPIRSGTSRKTNNGNDGRTENPPRFGCGECQGALACFEDDKMAAGVLRFAGAMEAFKALNNFIQEVEQDG